MAEKSQKIDQLIFTINDVIIEVEELDPPSSNQDMKFQIVYCLAEARNLLDEMKFEIPEDEAGMVSIE